MYDCQGEEKTPPRAPSDVSEFAYVAVLIFTPPRESENSIHRCWNLNQLPFRGLNYYEREFLFYEYGLGLPLRID